MSKPSNVTRVFDATIAVNQSIYEDSSSQETRIGTELCVGDRKFVYSKMDSTATQEAGVVLCAPLLTASHQSGITACAAATTGATSVTITAGSAITKNQYAEGYVSVASSGLAGAGVLYRVKSHSSIGSGATGALTLYDPIPGTLAAGPINLIPNRYNGILVGSEDLGMPVGVTPCTVGTGNYFWLQVKGPANVKHQGATDAAAGIKMGTLGGVSAAFSGGSTGPEVASILIGKNLNLAATATEFNPVYIDLE